MKYRVFAALKEDINSCSIWIENPLITERSVIKITNLDTGEEIVKERDFWFAWYAFHPETGLYEVKDVN